MTEKEREADFIAALAHDLRAPLATVNGFANALLDGTAPEEKRQDYLRLIANESARMAAMVDELLQLSVLEGKGLTAERFSLSEAARTALIAAEKRINEKGLDVAAEIDELFVQGNKAATQRVFANLLDNALKAVPHGGKLWIKVYPTPPFAAVDVGNSGEPIDGEDLPRLFDKYFTKGKNGTGLGLYLVKTAMEKQGGGIKVVSDTQGTVFTFTLPF